MGKKTDIRLHIDFETRSEVDLRKIGPYKYSIHKSTEVICMAYKFTFMSNGKLHKTPTKLWKALDNPMPDNLKKYFTNNSVSIAAHNSYFEYCIYHNVLRRDIDLPKIGFERFICTSAKGSRHALPRDLDNLGKSLDLGIQKFTEARAIMLKYCKPTQKWSNWKARGMKGKEPQKWHDDKDELQKLYDYCIRDTDTEALIDETLQDLEDEERDTWLINQKMNYRGLSIDTDLVDNVIKLLRQYTKIENDKLFKITGIDSGNKRNKILEWINSKRVVKLEGLTKDDVKSAIASLRKIDSVDAKNIIEVLKIRQNVSMSSNKKYFALKKRISKGKVRDIAMYHGASTGRESGTGFQVHNLPKGIFKDKKQIETAIDAVKSAESIEDVSMFYKDPAKVFSSLIRSCIIPSEGHELFISDFNAIEARVVLWIAKHEPALDLFRQDKDPYKHMASKIYGVKIEDVTDEQRFVGKICVLACGYGMGYKKFLNTCQSWGAKDVSLDVAKKAVETYRNVNQPIVKLWSNVEQCAIRAVHKKGKVFSSNRVSWVFEGKFLKCILPSGRALNFYKPSIRMSEAPWGEKFPKLYYYSIDSQTKKFVERGVYGGLLTENICQGISRDITVNAYKNAIEDKYKYLFQVHDEIISEAKKDTKTIEDYDKNLGQNPKWALDLPIKVSGYKSMFYMK